MSLLQDKTRLTRMLRLSTLGDHSSLQWSASSACSTLVVKETFTGHQRIPVSTVVCCLSTEWLAWPRPRHDGVISHRAAHHPRQDQLRHPSAYSYTAPTRGDSYIPKSSTSVSSQCRSQGQAETQVISSRAHYTYFTQRPPLV